MLEIIDTVTGNPVDEYDVWSEACTAVNLLNDGLGYLRYIIGGE